MLFINSYKNDFWVYFCFPNIIMNILNIVSAIKKMAIKKLKDF